MTRPWIEGRFEENVITTTVEQAQQLIDLAQAQRRVLQVGLDANGSDHAIDPAHDFFGTEEQVGNLIVVEIGNVRSRARSAFQVDLRVRRDLADSIGIPQQNRRPELFVYDRVGGAHHDGLLALWQHDALGRLGAPSAG